ncbi:MAG: DUF1959 domain-containing protein [Methanomicrobiales archaeon]|nr:DUF1959 domain-containing protein [Methanomicrobiales archaeon]
MEVLYEKDLRPYKFRILISARHDRLLQDLAERFGMSRQDLRKWMIETFDMQLLENLPARYEAGLAAKEEDPIAEALGAVLFTRFIPLLERSTMDRILGEVRDLASTAGTQAALEKGNARIREALTT